MRDFCRLFAVVMTNSSAVFGFRCFSEYEFNWWDGSGAEHINGFSMSHFQMKMRNHFTQSSTHRLPIKEANFLVRLHPTYRTTLVSDCPHALISAHILLAIFTAESHPSEVSLNHYKEAIKLLNEAPRIHQEVTLYAWPLNTLLTHSQATLQTPQLAGEHGGATIVIFGLQHRASFLHLLSQSLSQPQDARLIVNSSDISFLDRRIMGVFGSVQVLHSNASMCHTQLGLMSQLLADSFPVIFVDLNEDISEHLIPLYLNFLRFRRSSEVPDFYSFGKHRSLPNGQLKGSYASHSFAISNKANFMEKAERIRDHCSSMESGGIWENAFKQTDRPFFTLRCDDPTLPVALRLCAGNEHIRTDWRDTILAPVLPRHPVMPIE